MAAIYSPEGRVVERAASTAQARQYIDRESRKPAKDSAQEAPMAETAAKDGNGNVCTVAMFGSLVNAKAALASLKNCTDCINCKNCTD